MRHSAQFTGDEVIRILLEEYHRRAGHQGEWTFDDTAFSMTGKVNGEAKDTTVTISWSSARPKEPSYE